MSQPIIRRTDLLGGTNSLQSRISLSGRSSSIQGQPMFRLMTEAKLIEAQGNKVHHLEIGDTSGLINEALIARIRAKIDASHMGYSPSVGLGALRAWIANTITKEKGWNCTIDHVVISVANALLTQILTIVADPGDAVLIPDPGFPTYRLAADFTGLKTVYYPLHQTLGWNPDFAAVLAQLPAIPRLRTVIINSPSNPLGVVHDPAGIDRLIAGCERLGISVVFDETYKNLVFDGEMPRIPHHDNVIYVGSFSKELAAPGIRLGYAVGAPAIIEKIVDYNSLFFSCLPISFQAALVDHLERDDPFCLKIRTEIGRRVELVCRILDQVPGISYVRPNAAFYVFVNIASFGMSADDLALSILHQTRVCVCPGTGFGPQGHSYLRLSLAGPFEDMLEGCRCVAAFLSALAERGNDLRTR